MRNVECFNFYVKKLRKKYLEKHKIKTADDLLRCNLLNNNMRPFLWNNYLKLFGIKKSEINHGVSFEHFFMQVEAVRNGIGIGLLPQILIEDELKQGSLVIAFPKIFTTGYYYQLIYPKHKAHLKKIEDFKEWAKTLKKKFKN